MATLHQVRPGAYYDSVVLMQLQHALADLPEVIDAGVVMGTVANLELLSQNDILPDEMRAAPEDLVIVVQAETEVAAEAALGQVDELLSRRRLTAASEFRPKSLQSAAEMLPEAGWVLISIPGRYAAAVASEALDLGKHVFLYSDNVSIDDEVELKARADELELLMMGPDCGTAIVGGIGFGFANRVRPGSIGLVGASGTGLQSVSSRIHQLGEGVSQALGTGSRDLKESVAGAMATRGLDLLASDPETEVIVLVSKPPDPAVTARLLQRAWAAGKPTVVSFIGYPPPARQLGNLHFANSLIEAADLAVGLLGAHGTEAEGDRPSGLRQGARFLRGLFSGGTLAAEALAGVQALLGPVYSNIGDPRLSDPLISKEHSLLDLGEDVFTVGRLHPMIDNDLRIRRLRQEAADPEVALILLDIVLGEGAHPDPASELAPAIAEARAQHNVEVVVILVGTDEDPQNLAEQKQQLRQAGAVVFADMAAAVVHAVSPFTRREVKRVEADFLSRPVAAINVGLESFYDSLREQGAKAVHVDWKPPAGGDERLQAILQKMKN
ncbi:MAG: acyl-CoA synthetase FdrA [Anaerolineales bacterium]